MGTQVINLCTHKKFPDEQSAKGAIYAMNQNGTKKAKKELFAELCRDCNKWRIRQAR